MTQNTSNQPTLRLPVPHDQAVFTHLSTDFYPWTEIVSELEAAQSHELTAILDVQQDARWARFVWVRGQLRGGIAASGSEVTLADAMRGLPRAHVSLIRTEPLVAEVVWECRKMQPQLVDVSWPEAQAKLIREQFQGALLSGPHCSFWEGGRVMLGTLPAAGMPCFILTTSKGMHRETLLRVWREVIKVTYRAEPRFDEVWRQVSMQLSAQYPALDPFAGELTVTRGQLNVENEVPTAEFRSAMLDAYRHCLRRLELRVEDLPFGQLRLGSDWADAGLENL